MANLTNTELVAQVDAWSNLAVILFFIAFILLAWIFLGRRIKASIGFKIKKNKYEIMKERCERIEPLIDTCKEQISILRQDKTELKQDIEQHQQAIKEAEHTRTELSQKCEHLEREKNDARTIQKQHTKDLTGLKITMNKILDALKNLPEQEEESNTNHRTSAEIDTGGFE